MNEIMDKNLGLDKYLQEYLKWDVSKNIYPSLPIHKTPKAIKIDTEFDLNYWAFIPMICLNRHFFEIELRWLCFAIFIIADKRKFKHQTKQYTKTMIRYGKQ